VKPQTLNLISYSGGKDSGALALHLKSLGIPNLVLVFCDTQWEHPVTMRYVYEFARAVGLRLVVLESEGMAALCGRKKRAPSVKARFCTEELKLKPFRAYVNRLKAQGFGVVVYLGERAEESHARAQKPRTEISNYYHAPLVRAIHDLRLADVIAIHRDHGIPMNPLYSQGMGRVGCMPCIMARKGELGAIARRFPETFDKVAELERVTGHTWWAPGFIPERMCSVDVISKDGRTVAVPTAGDVKRWALNTQDPKDLIDMFTARTPCESPIGYCE
jgi:3'-phosphoadenosine 5'-phosphosulfate sulfotransferase (PAPS reductase)/FAD synthetase